LVDDRSLRSSLEAIAYERKHGRDAGFHEDAPE